MDENKKKKDNKNLRVIGVTIGASIVSIFSVIIGTMTIKEAITSIAVWGISATIARITMGK